MADTSVTNYVYPANPLPHEGSRSSSIGSLGNGPGTQFPNSATNDAGTSHTRIQAPTTTTSPSSGIGASPGFKDHQQMQTTQVYLEVQRTFLALNQKQPSKEHRPLPNPRTLEVPGSNCRKPPLLGKERRPRKTAINQ